jgi:ribosomal protein L37AE/L43A
VAKITWDEEEALERSEVLDISEEMDQPTECPSCGRYRVCYYSDGSAVCEKCDEIITRGALLQTISEKS